MTTNTTAALPAHGHSRFARRVGPYAQDRDGAWFTLNPQRGWVPVPNTSRGLRSYLDELLRRRCRDERAYNRNLAQRCRDGHLRAAPFERD
jgi:hypothetical protein